MTNKDHDLYEKVGAIDERTKHIQDSVDKIVISLEDFKKDRSENDKDVDARLDILEKFKLKVMTLAGVVATVVGIIIDYVKDHI